MSTKNVFGTTERRRRTFNAPPRRRHDMVDCNSALTDDDHSCFISPFLLELLDRPVCNSCRVRLAHSRVPEVDCDAAVIYATFKAFVSHTPPGLVKSIRNRYVSRLSIPYKLINNYDNNIRKISSCMGNRLKRILLYFYLYILPDITMFCRLNKTIITVIH